MSVWALSAAQDRQGSECPRRALVCSGARALPLLRLECYSSTEEHYRNELAKDKDVETCIEEGGRKGKTIKDSYREQFVRNLASDDYLVLAKNGGGFKMGFIDTRPSPSASPPRPTCP